MPFQPKALINTVVCRHCKGAGCNSCQQQGVYGEMEGQTLIFDLPMYLAVKERRQAREIFILKRVILFLIVITIVFLIWQSLVFNN